MNTWFVKRIIDKVIPQIFIILFFRKVNRLRKKNHSRIVHQQGRTISFHRNRELRIDWLDKTRSATEHVTFSTLFSSWIISCNACLLFPMRPVNKKEKNGFPHLWLRYEDKKKNTRSSLYQWKITYWAEIPSLAPVASVHIHLKPTEDNTGSESDAGFYEIIRRRKRTQIVGVFVVLLLKCPECWRKRRHLGRWSTNHPPLWPWQNLGLEFFYFQYSVVKLV